MWLAQVLPKAGSKSARGRVPGAGVPCALPHAGVPGPSLGTGLCASPAQKTPLLVLSWGLLLLLSTPKSLAGEGPTQPPGWGMTPGHTVVEWAGHTAGVACPREGDMTQGCPPSRSRAHPAHPYWLPRTLPPREGLHAWGGGSCWDSVGCGGQEGCLIKEWKLRGPRRGDMLLTWARASGARVCPSRVSRLPGSCQ